MTSQKTTHIANIRGIGEELLQLLDGMDYCLDWKPDAESWSAREVVYHLLETPPGGLHDLIQGILTGERKEFDLVPGRSNMTAERMAKDLEGVRQDASAVLQGLEIAISSVEGRELAEKPVLAHLPDRRQDEERTVDMLLEGLFARHWRGHLAQIRELRESLGM